MVYIQVNKKEYPVTVKYVLLELEDKFSQDGVLEESRATVKSVI